MYKELGNGAELIRVEKGVLQKLPQEQGRIILQNGYVIDPANELEGMTDVAVRGTHIEEVGEHIVPESGDYVINCKDLWIVPGLVDMHLHMGDLFEVSTRSIECAVEDGVTLGISPGAGNTFMAPALLGAEVDRGLPVNVGVLIGAANVLGTCLSVEELIRLFKGELEADTAAFKLSRNYITNCTAPLVVGIKDHMGHFIMPDSGIEKIFKITSQAKLLYMSHTQDSEHAKRMFSLSGGRPLHLAHATAAGTGSHGDALKAMRDVIALCNSDTVTAEFVTSMLRKGLGSREGLQMTERARMEALEALSAGVVKILVSDGQNQSTMKGFGDTRDNIPAIIELVEDKVLSLSEAIATMTVNPISLLARRTGNDFWKKEFGHLGVGARANITVIDAKDKLATYTMVNGKMVSFENRLIRKGMNAGCYISKFGAIERMGIGDLAMKGV